MGVGRLGLGVDIGAGIAIVDTGEGVDVGAGTGMDVAGEGFDMGAGESTIGVFVTGEISG